MRLRLLGHSFGGLVAAEIAAAAPKTVEPARADRSGRPVARRPAGQELDAAEREGAPAVAVRRSRGRSGATLLRVFQSDPAERIDTLAQFIWAQACTGKFVWPIADRGFRHRAHRIAAPTLIFWGNADRIIAPAYAQEFAKLHRRRAGAS